MTNQTAASDSQPAKPEVDQTAALYGCGCLLLIAVLFGGCCVAVLSSPSDEAVVTQSIEDNGEVREVALFEFVRTEIDPLDTGSEMRLYSLTDDGRAATDAERKDAWREQCRQIKATARRTKRFTFGALFRESAEVRTPANPYTGGFSDSPWPIGEYGYSPLNDFSSMMWRTNGPAAHEQID